MIKIRGMILAAVVASLGYGAMAMYTSRMSAEPARGERDVPESNAADRTGDSATEIACALTHEELEARRGELLPALFQRAEKVTDLPSGFRLQFASSPNLLGDLTRVIEQERVCCRFL